MVRRARILLALHVLLAGMIIGCGARGSDQEMEATIVAKVVATLESTRTASAGTQMPKEPTATPEPVPTTGAGPSVTPPPEIEAEEYAVYSAMIQQNPTSIELSSAILIREQTISDLDQFERTLAQVDPLPAQLIDSYRSRNTVLYTIKPDLDIEQSYGLMPEEAFQQILLAKGSVWSLFQEAYPEVGGIVSFSRVGFGTDSDEALVLMAYRCGDLCGAGGLYLLTKQGGRWLITAALMEWMS